MTHIIIPGQERPLKCRWCPTRFREGEIRAYERHVHRCTEEHLQRKLDERARLDFLKPLDPEWAEWVQSGKHKPQTRPN